MIYGRPFGYYCVDTGVNCLCRKPSVGLREARRKRYLSKDCLPFCSHWFSQDCLAKESQMPRHRINYQNSLVLDINLHIQP